jgi:hypothetical protein
LAARTFFALDLASACFFFSAISTTLFSCVCASFSMRSSHSSASDLRGCFFLLLLPPGACFFLAMSFLGMGLRTGGLGGGRDSSMGFSRRRPG